MVSNVVGSGSLDAFRLQKDINWITTWIYIYTTREALKGMKAIHKDTGKVCKIQKGPSDDVKLS